MNTISEIAKRSNKSSVRSYVKVVRVNPEGFYSENPTGKRWHHQIPQVREEYTAWYSPKVRSSFTKIQVGLSVLSKIQSRIDKRYFARKNQKVFINN